MQLRLKDSVYLVDSVDEKVMKMIESDCQRLKQILINLLRNSTKFTFKGFIHIVLRPKNLVLVEGNKAIGFSEAV